MKKNDVVFRSGTLDLTASAESIEKIRLFSAGRVLVYKNSSALDWRAVDQLSQFAAEDVSRSIRDVFRSSYVS